MQRKATKCHDHSDKPCPFIFFFISNVFLGLRRFFFFSGFGLFEIFWKKVRLFTAAERLYFLFSFFGLCSVHSLILTSWCLFQQIHSPISHARSTTLNAFTARSLFAAVHTLKVYFLP